MSKEYETERKYGYAWNAVDTASTKYPTSHIRRSVDQRLEKAIDDMDKELPVAELGSQRQSLLEKLLAMPAKRWPTTLYFIDTLVSTKRRSSLNNVQENMKDVYQEATGSHPGRENYESAQQSVFASTNLRNVFLQRRTGRP